MSALNQNNPDIRLFIFSVMISATCTINLCLMFLPKILYKENKEPRTDVHLYKQETPNGRSIPSYGEGEKILTSKTRGQLVMEITELRKRLAASTREECGGRSE